MASSFGICWRCQSAALHALRTGKKRSKTFQPRNSFSMTYLRLRSSPDPTSSLFPIFQPSFWRSVLPKRSRLRPDSSSTPPRQHWIRNPATHIIILSLLAGSQAIQILALKREHMNYSLRTDAHIAKLREVIGRVQKGEDVDVKKELGTGDPKREKEWEEVMREIEKEDEVFVSRRRAKREENVKLEEQGNGEGKRQAGTEDRPSGEDEKVQVRPTSREPLPSGVASGGSSGSQIRYY